MLDLRMNLRLARLCASLLTMLAAAAPSHATGNQQQPEARSIVTRDCIGEDDDYDDTVQRLRRLYQGRKFVELDATLACLLRGSSRFGSGRTGSSAVYWMFRRQMPAPGASQGEVAHIQDWRQQQPDSIFAEFADLRLKYAMAWNARGTSYAREVPDAAWKAFSQGLVDTEHAVLQARKELRQTPIWQNLLLAVVLDMKNSQSEARVVFEDGAKHWPNYYDFYEVALTRLVPRWGGSWEEVETFIDHWSARLRSNEGDSLYARLYASVIANGASPRETQLRWPRMKRSLDDLITRYPDPTHKNVAASFACAYNDSTYFKASFQRIQAKELRPAAWIRGTDPNSCAR